MKKIATLLILLCTVVGASAQISTGQSTSSVLKMGNRPTAGDWGIYVGIAYSDFESIFATDMSFEGFPLVNVKHYLNDNLEARFGLQLQGVTTTISSESEYDLESVTLNSKYKSSVSDATRRFRPGIAYHFSNKNLLDVYVGAEIPFGWNKSTVTYQEVEGSSEYESFNKEISNSPFFIGVGAFIGLQCFVADLPLAFGIEYGLLGIKEFGYDKTKVVSFDEDGNKQTQYYSSSTGSGDGTFDSLKSSRKSFANDARFTITYYFKSK